MLKKNLNNGEAALCNGALGTIRAINYRKNDDIVVSLDIKFDNLTDIYTLEKVSHDYEYQKNIYVTRTQFPLAVSWALSIHKTQGLSLDCALIDIGADIFEPGMAYVALSRVKKLKNAYLISFDNTKLACDGASIQEYNRLYIKYKKGTIIENYTTWNEKNKSNLFLKRDLLTINEVIQGIIKFSFIIRINI